MSYRDDRFTCDYVDCVSDTGSSWNWVTASNGLDEVTFCSQKHHDHWMQKNAGNFWDYQGLLSGNYHEDPRATPEDTTGPLTYKCKLSQYITDENKQSVIQSLMTQFQGYGLNPSIVAPQGSLEFTLSLDRGTLSTSEIRDKLLWNYFIESVTTRSDAKTVRNLHVDLSKSASVGNKKHGGPIDKRRKHSSMNVLSYKGTFYDFSDPVDCNCGHSKCQLTDDDLRHGSHEGYGRGCRCELCSYAKRNFQYAGEVDPTVIRSIFVNNPQLQNHGTWFGKRAMNCPCDKCENPKEASWDARLKVRPTEDSVSSSNVETDQFGHVTGQLKATEIGLTDPSNVRTSSTESPMVTGVPYDSSVDSNLHVETSQNPQYIIDQDNIDGPQRTASCYAEVCDNEVSRKKYFMIARRSSENLLTAPLCSYTCAITEYYSPTKFSVDNVIVARKVK